MASREQQCCRPTETGPQIDSRVECQLRKAVDSSADGLIACVTGANSGIGLELAKRLAVSGVRVVMVCRNKSRGEEAVAEVKATARAEGSGDAVVDLVLCDVSEPDSVRHAAKELRALLPRIDLLYLNAGTMPVEAYNWAELGRACMAALDCSGERGGVRYFLETGRAWPSSSHFLTDAVWATLPDRRNHRGAPHLLATHVLGHVLLVRELRDLLSKGRVPELRPALLERASRGRASSSSPRVVDGGSEDVPTPRFPEGAPCDEGLWVRPDLGEGGGGARVVWTGSRAASMEPSFADPKSASPLPMGYGDVKATQDLMNRALQKELGDGIHCVVAGPGFVATELTPWFMQMGLPVLHLIRPHVCGQQLSVRNGCAPHLAVALASPSVLRSDRKFIVHRGMLTNATSGWRDFTVEWEHKAVECVNGWLEHWK
jgi:NAD(P)-dependent dehydrogenase (short-subunit alcohol dehydrogenase family)